MTSFAGQHDSYLNVSGGDAVLAAIRRCWASLFTERAVEYRRRHGIDHRAVEMAVVVQQMVDAEAAGVMFTADPVSGNRRVVSVEAVAGLGEAFVAGAAKAEIYTVRDGAVLDAPSEPLLTRSQIVRLAEIGRRIEARSVARRTSSGAWPRATSRSSRPGRSPRCSRSPRRRTGRTTCTSQSVTSR